MAALPKTNLTEDTEIQSALGGLPLPTGFEVVPPDGNSRRVRLRRALHSGAPLGIAIVSRDGERRSIIEQYDIGPRLDALTRTTVQDILLRVYMQLKLPDTFVEAKAKLDELASEGFCVGCRFSTVSRG